MGVKKMAAAVVSIGILLPTFAFAQTSTSTIETLLNQIKVLQQQIVAMQHQQQQNISSLLTALKQGSTGDQVKTLQALLAADPAIYPEGIISGFYGPKTAAAVMRFQKKFGIEQLGNVGPKTLQKLNELLSQNPIAFMNSTSTSDRNEDRDHHMPCAIVPPGHLIAPGWLKHHDGVVPIVPPCQKLPPGIHGHDGDDNDDGDDHDGNDHHGTTTPDTIAPTITAIAATAITVYGATITWTTNENATSQVEYGTTNAYGATTTLNTSRVISHAVVLTGLASSTMYHFRVRSADAANNNGVSGDVIFTTSTPSDTTAPVISGVTVSSVASTTATVLWTTNEAATSKIYYGTTNPVNLASALSVSSTTLVTGHSVTLNGLTANTTYFYVLESKDAANNTATTTSLGFVTTN